MKISICFKLKKTKFDWRMDIGEGDAELSRARRGGGQPSREKTTLQRHPLHRWTLVANYRSERE